MSDKKILITGTGGCGSGFIIRTMENCGFDIGGYNSYIQHGPVKGLLKAGVDPKTIEMPRVIKHLGGFMKNLNEHIDNFGWEVEHIFLSVVPYEMALGKYMSRRNYTREDAAARYTEVLGLGMQQLIERDHPFTVVRCPETILCPRYMYEKVKIVLPKDFTLEDFEIAHAKTIAPKYKNRLLAEIKEHSYDPVSWKSEEE